MLRARSVSDLADKAYAEFGVVHLLFNNAGVGLGEAQRKLWDLPVSDWNWGMAVNTMGPVRTLRWIRPLTAANPMTRTASSTTVMSMSVLRL